MDFGLKMDNGQADLTWEAAPSLVNNIYLSLFVEKGRFFMNPEFGSRLHLLKRAKGLSNVAETARDYCLEALEWLTRTNKAKTIEVETAINPHVTGCLAIRVKAVKGDGQTVDFQTFLEIV